MFGKRKLKKQYRDLLTASVLDSAELRVTKTCLSAAESALACRENECENLKTKCIESLREKNRECDKLHDENAVLKSKLENAKEQIAVRDAMMEVTKLALELIQDEVEECVFIANDLMEENKALKKKVYDLQHPREADGTFKEKKLNNTECKCKKSKDE